MLLSLKKSNEKIIKTFFVKSLKRIKCIPVPKLVHKIFLAHSFLHTRIRVWKGTLGPAPFFVVRVFQIMLSCVYTSLQFHSLCLMKCSTAKCFKICHNFIYQKPMLIFPCIQFSFWHANCQVISSNTNSQIGRSVCAKCMMELGYGGMAQTNSNKTSPHHIIHILFCRI